MRYFEFLKKIKNISTTHVLVNEYGEGDIYEHLNSGEHKYPCVFLTVTNIQSSVSSTLYNFTLFYTDRLLESGDNRTNIQSTGITVIQQILNRLVQEYPTYEVTNTNFTPFTEKFADMCAGTFCDITFEDPVENLESVIDSECNEGDFEVKTITLTKNGLYDINGYDKAIVAIPFETLIVEEEGVYTNEEGGWNRVEVAHMANVQENVTIDINDITTETFTVYPDEGYDGIGEVIINNYTGDYVGTFDTYIGTNGLYELNPANSGLKAFDKVNLTINCPAPTPITITEDGTYEREGGYNPVVVNTPRYEIISLNQKQYNAITEYNEYAVYLITYDNTIPSVEGDYFYIESQEDGNEISFIANTDYTDMTNCIAYEIGRFEVSTNLHDWYKLSDIATEVDWGYYTVTLNKYDRLFIRNVYGEFLTNFYESKNFTSIVSGGTKHFSIGGDLHTVIFKYTDRITELPIQSYLRDIFSFVSNLIDASDLILPATKLPNRAYDNMFAGSRDLIYPPKILPATDLGMNVYQTMFKWCNSLVEAPELPATTLNYGCYKEMFYNCASLVKAPELPAINLPVTNYAHQGCYTGIFYGCTNLNYVKCLGLNDISWNTGLMLRNVSSTGTFIKHPDAEWVIGDYGIPSGWTIENANIEDI